MKKKDFLTFLHQVVTAILEFKISTKVTSLVEPKVAELISKTIVSVVMAILDFRLEQK
jgi:hypothetical protein